MRRLVVVLALLVPAAARADAFDGATRIRHADDLLWPLTAACDRGDDVQQRQCRQLRDRKRAAIAGGTFLVDAEPAAVVGWITAARVELVVVVPTDRRGQLEVIAYRIVEPPAAAAPAPLAGPSEPAVLTAALVREAMKPVVEAANVCFVKLNAPGRSRIEMTIHADGTVAAYELLGDHAHTPTGACIEAALKAVRFPRTAKPTTKIAFPIVLL